MKGLRHIVSPIIILSISFGMNAPVRNRRNNIIFIKSKLKYFKLKAENIL